MNINSNDRKIVNITKIQEIVNQIDPRHTLDPEVEEILLEIADEFMDSVTGFACALAKHRQSDQLEVKDLQLHLQKNWGMKIPGYMIDEEPSNYNELQPASAKRQMTEEHKKRVNWVKRAEYSFQKKTKKNQPDTQDM
jgi:transcription initiation factor TFIID subunit 12